MQTDPFCEGRRRKTKRRRRKRHRQIRSVRVGGGTKEVGRRRKTNERGGRDRSVFLGKKVLPSLLISRILFLN